MSEMKTNGNLSCEVVRDLMPLYVEELTGEETNRQMQAHIGQCPVCAQAMGMQQARLEIEKNGKKRDMNGIRFLKKQWMKRIALVLAIAVLALVGCWVVDGVFFSEQAVHESEIYPAGCYQLSDGRIVVAFGVEGLSPAQLTNGARWMDTYSTTYLISYTSDDHRCGRNMNLVTNNFKRWFGRADERGEIFYYLFDPEQVYHHGDMSINAFMPVVSKEDLNAVYSLGEIFVNGYAIWQRGDEAKALTAEEEAVLLAAVEKSMAGNQRISIDALSTLMK